MASRPGNASCLFASVSHCLSEEMKARLVNGDSVAGRLEIFFNREWSTVCGRDFGKEKAMVACRMLGYNSTDVTAVSSAIYGEGSGPILFEYLQCVGTETSLAQCQHHGLYNTYFCSHQHDVGVICNTGPGHLRLVDSPRTQRNMGYVQIQLESEWYSVCIASDETSRVICRQLNLSSEAATLAEMGFLGAMKSAPLSVSFDCEGHENSTLECNRTYKKCLSTTDGVFCSQSASLYIVSDNNTYPILEGTRSVLQCRSPRQLQLEIAYTWPHMADGVAFQQNLIFNNPTRAQHGRQVRCTASYTSIGRSHVVSSDDLELQVYYHPSIKITRSDNPGVPLEDDSNHTLVTPGHDLTFRCEADSNPPPTSVTWSGNVNSSTGDLQILAADQAVHGGVYSCTVVTGTAYGDSRLPLTSSRQITVVVTDTPQA